MSADVDGLLEFLEFIVKRKRIIRELFPNNAVVQSELAEKTKIRTSNLSRYIRELEEKGIVNISTGVNAKGQPVRVISLEKVPIEIIRVSAKLASAGKPILEDLESLGVFMDGLFEPELQEFSKNSIQIISTQYIVPIESSFFNFLGKHLLDDELEGARRVLVISAGNMVREMDEYSKRSVLRILEPVLQRLLEDASGGLKQETMKLLRELGVYDLPYHELESLYISDIKKHKVPGFFRALILSNHHNKVQKLRASLVKLHPDFDEAARSIVRDEFPLLR